MATIDNPPVQPNAASYPESALYTYGPLLTAQPVGTPFDQTQPQKYWIRPLQPGEDPGEEMLYGAYVGTVYMANHYAITLGAAAVANIPPGPAPVGVNPVPPGWAQSVQIPARALFANEVAFQDMPGSNGFMVQRTDMSQAPGTAPPSAEGEVLAGIQEIEQALGLPKT